jgi:hypothetical protein
MKYCIYADLRPRFPFVAPKRFAGGNIQLGKPPFLAAIVTVGG